MYFITIVIIIIIKFSHRDIDLLVNELMCGVYMWSKNDVCLIDFRCLISDGIQVGK